MSSERKQGCYKNRMRFILCWRLYSMLTIVCKYKSCSTNTFLLRYAFLTLCWSSFWKGERILEGLGEGRVRWDGRKWVARRRMGAEGWSGLCTKGWLGVEERDEMEVDCLRMNNVVGTPGPRLSVGMSFVLHHPPGGLDPESPCCEAKVLTAKWGWTHL